MQDDQTTKRNQTRGRISVEQGNWGEEVAATYFMQKGWRVVARNVRPCPADRRCEIDLIVKTSEGGMVFVEVKTRRNEVFASAESAADEQKMRRIAAAARTYMHEKGLWQPYRFDVIAVVGEAPPFTLHHHRFAYRPHRA